MTNLDGFNFDKLEISSQEISLPIYLADKLESEIKGINNTLLNKIDSANVYTKSQSDDLLALKQAKKGFDENYVTDSQLVILNNTSGINTGDETAQGIVQKLGYTPANSSYVPFVFTGLGAPVSVPAKVGDIYIDTTNYKTYIAKGVASSADWLKQNSVYVLTAGSVQTAATDANTYYIGQPLSGVPSTVATYRKIIVPCKGTIENVSLNLIQTAGSSETSSIYMRVNNTTDYLISNAVVNSASFANYTKSLSIPVNKDDFLELKWVTPVWATNPSNIYIQANITIAL